MPYDPVRDREVSASPADASPAYSLAGGYGPPRNVTPGSSSTAYEDQHRLYDGPNGRPPPPAFSHGPPMASPSVPMTHRTSSGGGGLRSLLNEDARDGARDDEPRSRVNMLLNESYSSEGRSDLAQPLSKTTSRSSRTHSDSPHMSPAGGPRPLEGGFLAPYPAGLGRSDRSPQFAARTPSLGQGVPYSLHAHPGHAEPYHLHAHGHDAPPQGSYPAESSRRSSVDPMYGQMLPPDPRQHRAPSHDSQGHQQPLHPGISHLTSRSPSASISPRSHIARLPSTSPGPGSAYPPHPHQQPFAFVPPPVFAAPSPPLALGRLSEGPSRPGTGERQLSSRSRKASTPRRKSSQTSEPPMYSPVHLMPVRSPSPIPRPAYNPQKRVAPPSAAFHSPILPKEADRLRAIGLKNNPLRRKLPKSATPGWDRGSPGSRPTERDESYFPSQGQADGQRRSRQSFSKENGNRSVSHPPATPGGAGPGSAYPAFTPTPGGNAYTPGGSSINVSIPELDVPAKRARKRISEGQDIDKDGSDDRHDAVRRKVSGHFGNAVAVADHYNSRIEVGVAKRDESPIIGLKRFNNWIKSVLIGKFCYQPPEGPSRGPGAKVLDIGMGKGGDLKKWQSARIQLYVGLDIAAVSIEQAAERYGSMGRVRFAGYFFVADCYSRPISDVLPENLAQKDLYDNVSMQFCMHYAFETAPKARMMMENVSRFLRKGGIFIGTIPDSEMLLNRLNDEPEDSLEFGNSCYRVAFAERQHKGLYGHAYHFYLEDAVDDVPEFIVHWDNFESLALEYGLHLVYKKAFAEVLNEEQSSRDFGPLLGRMKVLDRNGNSAMDEDQWEAANLYMAFAFEKRR